MEAIYQFVKLDKSESLQEFAQKKLDKLENKYDWIVKAQVYFKKEEVQDPKGYICNIKLSAPGPQIFAESNENSFEAATSETIRDLERQLSKRKGQMKTHSN
ncbi:MULTISPECIES: ribosome hibernation-promoting factor, HPF/YfiA family [Salegentibacter]|jgi:putative sigma-54 modulation protein|uniref:Putative sigma-54 modulation protein n=1 Tax=Salegentibacter agarivorans TaxID=345907 RepID=A0A1I2KE91_9FLAO|nr:MULTISPECIES: ribosome-associated translation inhibitor RaiA [Salegentibacter]APS39594.1 30S ribosomal protein S30 [Salegentibacter sp. T436]SFF63411.1 putative sigma-54 modulation protein [Salegentibacter agarivorans]